MTKDMVSRNFGRLLGNYRIPFFVHEQRPIGVQLVTGRSRVSFGICVFVVNLRNRVRLVHVLWIGHIPLNIR